MLLKGAPARGQTAVGATESLGRRSGALACVVAFFLAAPLFVNVLGANVIELPKFRETYVGPGLTVPMSLFVTLGVLGIVVSLPRAPRRNLVPAGVKWPLVLYVYFNALALVIGQFQAHTAAESGLFFLQAVLPALAVMMPFLLLQEDQHMAPRVLGWCIGGSSVGLGLVFVINALALGANMATQYWTDNIQGLGIYQLDGYVPNVLATLMPLAFALAMVSRRGARRLWLYAYLPVAAFALTHLKSVSALLIGAAGMACLGVVLLLGGWRPSYGQVVLILIAIVMPVMLLSSGPLKDEASSLVDPSSSIYGSSVEHRQQRFGEGVAQIARSPLWGQAYRLSEGSTLGGLVPEARIGKPHNQYLDFGLRGGAPVLGSFLLMVGMSLRESLRSLRLASLSGEQRTVLAGMIAALTATLSVHCFVLVPFVQPFSGFLLYFLIGLMFWYARNIRSGRTEGERSGV